MPDATNPAGCDHCIQVPARGSDTMRLAKSVKFREEKFGGVLFETRSEKVFTLNPTAAAVVREIQAGRPEHELSLIHISEPTRLLSISYAVFCLKKKNS